MSSAGLAEARMEWKVYFGLTVSAPRTPFPYYWCSADEAESFRIVSATRTARYGECMNSNIRHYLAQHEHMSTNPELQARVPCHPKIYLEKVPRVPDWDWVWNSDPPVVQFFNELDKNITPEHDRIRQQRGKKLLGPAVASGDNGKNWLADFMDRVSGDPQDFLGLHYYGTDGNDAI
ncbi:MAG: hypothetical protein Q9169_003088 [Polycauliona sp. 2 TL-2023]